MRSVALLLLASLLAGADVLEQARAALAEGAHESRLSAMAAKAPPAERAAVLGLVAEAKTPWANDMASDFLDDRDPTVRAAAVTALRRGWPSRMSHLDQVRQALLDGDPRVAANAASFVAQIGDDGALPILATRLERDTDGSVRSAMTSLVGRDPGEPSAWRALLDERQQRLDGPAGQLRQALATRNPDQAREAIHALLFLKDQKTAVGLLLFEAAEAGDASVAALARSGLQALGGPVAQVLPPAIPVEGQIPERWASVPSPDVAAAGSARAQAVIPPWTVPVDPVGLVVGATVIGVIGSLTWMLWRVKPVRELTQRIAKAGSARFTRTISKGTKQLARRLQITVSKPATRRLAALTGRITRKPPTPP